MTGDAKFTNVFLKVIRNFGDFSSRNVMFWIGTNERVCNIVNGKRDLCCCISCSFTGCALPTRDEEVVGKVQRQTCSLVKQLTADAGEKSLDTVLQMSAADSGNCACLAPLVRYVAVSLGV